MIEPAGYLLFIAWAITVAVCDLKSRRIPNALAITGLVAASGCAFAGRVPFGIAPPDAALGAVAGCLVLLPFFMLRVMGAADVKVFAVLGAWCGVRALPGLWLAASLLAGIHAVALLVVTRTPVATMLRSRAPTFELKGHRATPYGTCLTLSALAWLGIRTIEGAGR
jgi:prepilin peptidase CpaA